MWVAFYASVLLIIKIFRQTRISIKSPKINILTFKIPFTRFEPYFFSNFIFVYTVFTSFTPKLVYSTFQIPTRIVLIKQFTVNLNKINKGSDNPRP